MKLAQLIVWVLVGLTIALVNIDRTLEWQGAFMALKVGIEFFLLIFGAYQILKSTQTQTQDFKHIIILKKVSPKFYHLIWMGVVLTIADFVLIEHYGNILSSDTILAAILFFYYFGQILYNNKPSFLLGTNRFVYDDYFPKGWSWASIQNMELDDEQMIIKDARATFRIPLQGADQIDPSQMEVELAAEVLDGSIHFIDDASNFRALIQESAEIHGFPLNLEEEAE